MRIRQRIAWIALVIMGLTLLPLPASAAQITSRKLTLVNGGTDGGSKPLGVVKHQFDFTLPGSNTVGSIKFQYCTSATGTCNLPTNLVTTSATLGAQSGVTSFTLVNATNGSPYLTRSAAAVGSNVAVSYRLDSVTNPSTVGSFYVRISTYSTTDTTGSAQDTGVVVASTATQITLTGVMPESLIFCTGATVGTTGGLPDCGTATPGAVSFNQEFSPQSTATATSQMSASTNAGTGYVITVSGTTLTSGPNTVPAITGASGSPGQIGTGQFGLNLRANTTTTSNPAVGVDIAPISNGTNYKAEGLTGYNTVDNFKFVSGNSIADSGNGGSTGPTDGQIYTASYIVNVTGSQASGTYTTTLTYVCTATF